VRELYFLSLNFRQHKWFYPFLLIATGEKIVDLNAEETKMTIWPTAQTQTDTLTITIAKQLGVRKCELEQTVLHLADAQTVVKVWLKQGSIWTQYKIQQITSYH